MKRSPILSTEDVAQEYELQRLLRPERFRKWKISKTSIANELLRREYGRNRDRTGPESLGEIDPIARAEPCPLEREETARALAAALAHLPRVARQTAIAIMAGGRKPDRRAINTLRGYVRHNRALADRLKIALTGSAE
jgi:hypothetical protein